MEKPNLTVKLWARLGPAQGQALSLLLALARERRLPLYLVGGSVRDLLLGSPTLDLDLVVEGDAPALAQAAAAALEGARATVHGAFGTATVLGPGYRLDLATARAESYPRPGALPRVRPAAIEDDLGRRDFTVHAMALALSGAREGRLLDPHGGLADLRSGLLRVLHEASFQDDATRILRAARYAARFSFHLEARTLAWMERDAPYLATISGPRLHHELLRTLEEERPADALALLEGLGALRHIHPALAFDDGMARAFALAPSLAGAEAGPPLYLAVLAARLTEGEAASLAQRLSLNRREREAVLAMPRLRRAARGLAGDASPSQAVRLLEPFPTAALWAFALVGDELARGTVLRYLREWRQVRPALGGRDLLRLGVPRGPRMGQLLAALRDARLEGRVRSREEEMEMVRALLAAGEVEKA